MAAWNSCCFDSICWEIERTSLDWNNTCTAAIIKESSLTWSMTINHSTRNQKTIQIST